MTSPRFGGPWTEEKLAILRAYLDAYTTALKNQPFTLIYVDGFAGAGSYMELDYYSEDYLEFREGSPLIALEVDDNSFDRLILIDEDAVAAEALLNLKSEHPGRQIEVLQGDANIKVPEFCRSMGDFDRAVAFLDPFATQLSWSTVEAIASTKKIDCWILFPLMAVSRMMPTDKEPDEATANQLDRIFGGHHYWQQSYRDSPQMSLFDAEPKRERASGQEIADRYRERLRTVFYSVAPTRRTLTNSKNVPLFDLFFAASNPKGAPIAIEIADHILKHW